MSIELLIGFQQIDGRNRQAVGNPGDARQSNISFAVFYSVELGTADACNASERLFGQTLLDAKPLHILADGFAQGYCVVRLVFEDIVIMKIHARQFRAMLVFRCWL